MNRILRRALALAHAVIENARIDGDRIVIGVRPWRRFGLRCPVCGRACECYDRSPRPRLWRAMDLARSTCFLEYRPRRVSCPEHGVLVESVPWARRGSRFTRDFEGWVACLAVRCTASAVAELARVEWHTVGGICARVYAELEAARGHGRFDGVRRIGIDETSYKKGHKYLTVVVDHDRGCLIWAHEGCGKAVLDLFLGELTREQRRGIEVVTADGARWIKALVKRRCPNARWVMDPFHVVQWANDALDDVRREEWQAAKKAAREATPGRDRPGRPRRGEGAQGGRRRDQGKPLRAGEEPGGPQRRPAREARGPQEEGGFAPVQGVGTEGGPEGGVPGGIPRRGREAAGRVAARGRVLQDKAGRGRREEGAEAQGRRRRGGRARHRQRTGRGHQQQDQGDGEDGLRLPQHGQPRGAADAEVLGLQAAASGQTGKARPEESGLSEHPTH